MSSEEEQLEELNDTGDVDDVEPVSHDDARVGDDVCVAVSSAGTTGRRRRRDGSLVAAMVLSVFCHGALAAAWWQWGPAIELPDFSIRTGAGGSPGSGTADDAAAMPVAQSTLPGGEMFGAVNRPDAARELDDVPAAPVLARSDSGSLDEAMTPARDLIAMGPQRTLEAPHAAGRVKPIAGSTAGELANETKLAPETSGAGGGGDGLAITGLSRLAANDPPAYPIDARRNGWQGTVVLQLLVNVDGHVSDVKILQSSGYKLLDDSAVKKVKTYVVSPYRVNGVATELQVNLPIAFQLRARR
jgi:TonB family protein